jgi:hypothetical protein
MSPSPLNLRVARGDANQAHRHLRKPGRKVAGGGGLRDGEDRPIVFIVDDDAVGCVALDVRLPELSGLEFQRTPVADQNGRSLPPDRMTWP